MHELGLTQSIVDAVLETVGRQRVIELWLEIGTLSGVLPDAVRFCFDLVAQGTPLEQARLTIHEPLGRGACGGCGGEVALESLVLLCGCGSSDVTVLTGLEMRVTSVEVE